MQLVAFKKRPSSLTLFDGVSRNWYKSFFLLFAKLILYYQSIPSLRYVPLKSLGRLVIRCPLGIVAL